MGRLKKFSRDEALAKALPIFWRKGFAATSLKDLEGATGINKSGLYGEFKGKEELFLASLERYFENRPNRALLEREPYGWRNVEDFLAACAPKGPRGCFAVNTLRELGELGEAAASIIDAHRARLKSLFARNVAEANAALSPGGIAEICVSFHYGLRAEQNLRGENAPKVRRRAKAFVAALKAL